MKAIYPGSFDPATNGHLDIITRASKFLEVLYVAALANGDKNPLFTIDERLALLRETTAHIENVVVVSFTGLVAQFAHANGITLLIRGVRAMTDFETEFQMALTNRSINSELETLFMPTSSNFLYLSSSIVKQVCGLGGNIEDMAPPAAAAALKKKLFKEAREWNR